MHFHNFRTHNHFIDVTEVCLLCILFSSIATDPSKNVIFFLFEILNTKLQTHFLKR
jgi:hypothetical protein